MKIIQGVYDLADEVLNNDLNVHIDNYRVDELGKKILKEDKPSFFDKKYKPNIKEILKELVASSINYCYFYGAHNIKHNNMSSTLMYEDVEKSFEDYYSLESSISKLIDRLSINRYPLLEERIKHLRELLHNRNAENFVKKIINNYFKQYNYNEKKYSSEELFNELIIRFPGFASDLFLKRASLFFIQLHRKFGWYENLMKKLFVPADYQVPKILCGLECIEYSDELSYKIANNILIPKSSLEEIQIRAATIKVCRKLQEITKWNISDIDTYIWTKRKQFYNNHHVTVTTDY